VDRNPDDVRGVTKAVNGGLRGLAARQAKFDTVTQALGQ
jgi:predicted chitinase